MADFNPTSKPRKGRKGPTTPRIDLTPMVDLGFLLITFFMFTTTLAKPVAMEIQMPRRPPENEIIDYPAIPAEATIILIPAAMHKVAWYRGTDDPSQTLAWRGFRGNSGIRSLIEDEVARVRNLPARYSREAHKLHVLIKPDTSAAYDDLVRTIDEMQICAVPYYSVLHPDAAEAAAVKKLFEQAYGNRTQRGL